MCIVALVSSALRSVGKTLTTMNCKKTLFYSFILADCVSGKLVKGYLIPAFKHIPRVEKGSQAFL